MRYTTQSLADNDYLANDIYLYSNDEQIATLCNAVNQTQKITLRMLKEKITVTAALNLTA